MFFSVPNAKVIFSSAAGVVLQVEIDNVALRCTRRVISQIISFRTKDISATGTKRFVALCGALRCLAGAFSRGYWKRNSQQWRCKPATRNYFKRELIINTISRKCRPQGINGREKKRDSPADRYFARHTAKLSSLTHRQPRRAHGHTRIDDARCHDDLVPELIGAIGRDLRSS